MDHDGLNSTTGSKWEQQRVIETRRAVLNSVTLTGIVLLRLQGEQVFSPITGGAGFNVVTGGVGLTAVTGRAVFNAVTGGVCLLQLQ